MTFKTQGEGFFSGTASSEVPDIERGELEQALKKAPLFLAIIFSYFCVFLAEQWNHDVIASSKTGILPNCIPYIVVCLLLFYKINAATARLLTSVKPAETLARD